MLLNLTVSKSILLNANLDKVWKGLITPAIVKDYLYGTDVTSDWKVGSTIVFQGDYAGIKYRDHGVILENVKNEKITYSYWSGFSGVEDKPENYNTIIYSLKAIDANTTEFTWTQTGYATEEGYNHSKNGMDAFLEQMKIVIEKYS